MTVTEIISIIFSLRKAFLFLKLNILLKLDRKPDVSGVAPKNKIRRIRGINANKAKKEMEAFTARKFRRLKLDNISWSMK